MAELDEEDAAGDWSDEDGEGGAGRRRWWLVPLVAVVLVVGLGVGLAFALSGGTSSGQAAGPEGVPVEQVPDLASANTTASGAPVDGITCRRTMQQGVAYHIHVHVAIFVNGQQKRIPAGAGIAAPRLQEHMSQGLFDDNGVSGCLYWLHVHANDGVIHVESPYKHTFTLGQFFDIWRQPLNSGQVGPARGTVVVYQNGKRIDGNPQAVPLLPHSVVQLDVGKPVVPFQPVHFKVTGLCGVGTRGCSASG